LGARPKCRKPVDLAAALAAEPVTLHRRLTLAELVQTFYARNPTADGRERLTKWLAALGEADAWTLPSETLERAAEALLAGGYKPSSVNRDLSTLGTVYRWAKRARITPRSLSDLTCGLDQQTLRWYK
jgi:hypothetical protein